MDTRTFAALAIVIALVAAGIFYLAGPGRMTTIEKTPPAATAPEATPATPPPATP